MWIVRRGVGVGGVDFGELRLARSEMAELLGLSYATVWVWETGQRRRSDRSLALLQRFLATHK